MLCVFPSLLLFYGFILVLCNALGVPHKINFTDSIILCRVYQFSKKHAMEECRQQVAQSQGVRAKLEVQRILLKEKLDQLGTKEPPSALKLDPDAVSLSSSTSNVCCLWQSTVVFVLLQPL